ncbi:hypothetical protein BGP_4780 [Beggiatoa sp. PS]|nr:hypothetical protein BGP_4780 [Beggiatoa sp. PS]
MLAHLRKMGLLLENKGDFDNEDSYDTHPLIRNYFGGQFKKQIRLHGSNLIWYYLNIFNLFQIKNNQILWRNWSRCIGQ